MEIIAILVVLALIATPILAIAAFIRASRASSRVDQLESEIQGLRQAQARLLRRTDDVPTTPTRGVTTDSPSQKIDPAPVAKDAGKSQARSAVSEDAVSPVEPVPPPRRTPPPPPPIPTRPVLPTPPPPAPVPPPTVAAPEIDPFPAGPGLGDRLRDWGLLPPQGLSLETGLAAWWATRLGILLAVVGVTFFGAYASRHTPSWLRWIELLVVSIGICFGGDHLRKRTEAFGRVVFSGGLALLYFTAFAGYAVAAVRITSQPLIGLALQGVALVAMGAVSLRRSQQGIATMAVGLGYVSCVFAISADLPGPAIPSATLLAAGAIALYLWRGWAAPFAVATPLAYAFFGVHAILPGPVLAYPLAMAYLLIVQALFTGADLGAVSLGRALDTRGRRILQVLNSSSAIVAAFLFTEALFPHMRATTYLLFATLNGATAVAYWLRREEKLLFHTAALKGTSLLSLALVATFSGPVLWLTLASQAGVLFRINREIRSRWLELAMHFTWSASAILLALDLANPTVFTGGTFDPALAASLVWAIATSLVYRFWIRDREADGSARLLTQSIGVITGILLLAAAVVSSAPTWAAGTALIAGLCLAATGWIVGHRLPAMIGAIPLVAAFPLYWLQSLPAGNDLDSPVRMIGFALLATAVAIFERIRRDAKIGARDGLIAQAIASLMVLLHLAVSVPRLIPAGLAESDGIAHAIVTTAALLVLHRMSRTAESESADKTPASSWIGLGFGLFLSVSAALRFPAESLVWPLLGTSLLLLVSDHVRRHTIVAAAGVVPVVYAAIAFAVSSGQLDLPDSGILVSGTSIFATILALAAYSRVRLAHKEDRFFPLAAISVILAAAVSHQVAFHALAPSVYFPVQAATALLFLVIGQARAFPRFRDLAALPLLPAVAVGVFFPLEPSGTLAALPSLFSASGGLFAIIFLGLDPGGMVTTGSWKEKAPRWPHRITINVGLATLVILASLVEALPGHPSSVAIAAAGSILLFLANRCLPRSTPVRWATVALSLAAVFLLFRSGPGGYLQIASSGFLAGLIIIVTGLRQDLGGPPRAWDRPIPLRTIHVAVGLIALLATAVNPGAGVEAYATVIWGLSGALVFSLGILVRTRDYRLAGLITLGLCLPRVFLVDIQEPLHRIIAFIVLGAVLLAIGYVYTRFQDRIVGSYPSPEPDETEAAETNRQDLP